MQTTKRSRYIVLFIYLLFPLFLWAYQKPYVLNINRSTYKAANKNWTIGQDERGIMYFGNDFGLLESDGMEWRLHRIPESPIVRALAVESNQTIYTGGFEELGRWDRDISGMLCYTSLNHLIKKEELKNENIWKIWKDHDRVYFQSFSRIYVYRDGVMETIKAPQNFLFLLRVNEEYLVQEMYGSLYRLDGNNLYKMPNCAFLHGSLVRVILPYGDHEYLIGTSSGEIYRYDGERHTLWNATLTTELKGEELNCGIYSAKRGMYYLGTQLNGVYEVNRKGEITNHFTSPHALQNNTVLSLYEDTLDNVWVGMDRGLAYIRYTDGFSYYIATERDAGAIYDATLWKDQLFIGTNQGLYCTPRERLGDQDFFSSLRLINGTQGQVWSFSQIGEQLFCAHNSGLFEINANLKPSPIYGIDTGVYRVLEANIQGVDLMLVVTYKGLSVIRKDTGKLFDMVQIDDAIFYVEVDHLDNIWLGTVSHGVYKCKLDVDQGAFRYHNYYGYENYPELPQKLRLFKSGGRIIFIGNDTFWSYDENLDKLTPNTYLNTCFESVNGIKKIVYIGWDQNWAITESSVFRFYYDGYIARMLDSYNVESDNLSLITMYENVSILNDSLSMICLDAGFILHNSTGIPNAEVSLPVPAFDPLQTSYRNEDHIYMLPDGDLCIPYNYNDVTIHFTVKNAFASDAFVQYQLTGVDQDWSAPVKVNHINYDRLPQGEYTFLLRTTDGLGHYSDHAALSFGVLPPWYNNYWAYLLYVTVTLLFLYVVWMIILRRYRNLHLQKIRAREAQHLRTMNEKLMGEIKQKNAELLTQTSFIIQRNELILKLKDMVDEFCTKNKLQHQPLYKNMNKLLSNNLESEDDWKTFLIKFEQKHDGFFKYLKTNFPQLTHNDLRLCACLKLNLETKDIASLMNLSTRAVENNRYRLRKKLNLSPNQNLNDYFLGID